MMKQIDGIDVNYCKIVFTNGNKLKISCFIYKIVEFILSLGEARKRTKMNVLIKKSTHRPNHFFSLLLPGDSR